MSSSIKLKNANGKIVSVTNSNANQTDKEVIYLNTVDELANASGSINAVAIVSDLYRGGMFVSKTDADIDPNTGSVYTVNNGTVFAKLGGGFWVRVDNYYSNANYFSIPLISKETTIPSNLSEYAKCNSVFIDNLRQVNFHTLHAEAGAHTFLIPDDKFRIAEASRSLEKSIGALDRVLFIGDSLTAINDGNSYTNQVARRLSDLKGGIKELGYLAYESTVQSAKQNAFNISLTYHGMNNLINGTYPYNSDTRKYSPDGKGFTIDGATGSNFIRLTMGYPELIKYDKVKLYYLKEPGGGTFTFRARGDSVGITVDTNGTLGLSIVDYTPNINMPSSSQWDLWIENMIGNVTVYGVDFTDSSRENGYRYDIFAISGGALWELVDLDYSALNSYMNYAKPDTVVINIGTNDSSQRYTAEQFITNLKTYTDRLKNSVSGIYDLEIVIVTPNSMQWTNFPVNSHAEYENRRRKFARDNNMMYIDTPSEIGNFNHAWQNGWMKDGTHPNAKGLDIIGGMIADKLITAMKKPISKFVPSLPSSKVHQVKFNVTGGAITNLVKTGKITGVTYNAVGSYTLVHTIGNTNYTIGHSVDNANRVVSLLPQTYAIPITVYSTSAIQADATGMTITIIEI